MHVDQSRLDAASGLKYTAIYSGSRKIDGWAHAPLSAEAEKAAQDSVDHVRDVFAELIGRQGRMSAKAALATEAAIFADAEAVEAKLADAVMTFDEALFALTAKLEDSMTTKTALNSSTSAAAVAAASAPAATAATAAPDATAAAATTDAQPVATKSGELTPPNPGEKCQLCGQTMPDDDDDDAGDAPGNGVEQETRAPAAPAAAAAVPQYSAEDASDTIELCALAKQPQLAAAFVKAKTPLKKVRADLLKLAADSAGEEINPTPPADPNAAQKSAQVWDSIVDKINTENDKASGRARR